MAHEGLSPAKRQLVDYVEGLALFENGDTRDVIRMGSMELWPGKILVAEILDLDPGYLSPNYVSDHCEPTERLYALNVRDICGDEIEAIDVNTTSGVIGYSFEDAEPFCGLPEGAPDFMIAAFFARYWLLDRQAEIS